MPHELFQKEKHKEMTMTPELEGQLNNNTIFLFS